MWNDWMNALRENKNVVKIFEKAWNTVCQDCRNMARFSKQLSPGWWHAACVQVMFDLPHHPASLTAGSCIETCRLCRGCNTWYIGCDYRAVHQIYTYLHALYNYYKSRCESNEYVRAVCMLISTSNVRMYYWYTNRVIRNNINICIDICIAITFSTVAGSIQHCSEMMQVLYSMVVKLFLYSVAFILNANHSVPNNNNII